MSFSVAAMRVNEVEVLTVAHKTYMTPCPPCFTQLVRDDLPILHARLLKQGRCRGFVRRELLRLTIYRGTRRSSRRLMINRYEIRKVIRVKRRTRPRLCYFRHSPAAWAKPFAGSFVICFSVPHLTSAPVQGITCQIQGSKYLDLPDQGYGTL